MTGRELQISFERTINALHDITLKPTSTDVEYWLNKGLEKFVKTRYSDTNVKDRSFEQNMKRITDLRNLVRSYTADVSDALPNTYVAELPKDSWFIVNEFCTIEPTNPNDNCFPRDAEGNFIPQRSYLKQTTHNELEQELYNKLSEYRFHRSTGHPLRIYIDNTVQLYTDENYKVNLYNAIYICKPPMIDIHTSPNEEYTGLHEQTHQEIVELAVSAYLENTANPRYQTHMNEVMTQE